MPIAAIAIRIRVDDLSSAMKVQHALETALPLDAGLVSSSCTMDVVPWVVTGVDTDSGQIFRETVEAESDVDAVRAVGSGAKVVVDASANASASVVGSA